MTTEDSLITAEQLRQADLSRGSNQTAVRLYNERLVLSLIRRQGSLPKAEIARLTGLSAQTISVIIKQLEADGLVLKAAPTRGKVGQPSVPFVLNPDGVLSIGLKIGRRSSDLILMDFVGQVRQALHQTYAYPQPQQVLAFVEHGIAQLVATLSVAQRARIAGLGIVAPFELWSWAEEVGAPPAVLAAWQSIDLAAAVATVCPWPIEFCNDATAACAAELMFGNSGHYADFLYVFVGSFVGGGVVLNGSLYPGRTGNAGALGSMPVPAPNGTPGWQQLIKRASIYVLEQQLIAAGQDPAALWQQPGDWSGLGPLLDRWIEDAAQSLALASLGAISVIDFQAIVIDGAFPASVRAKLVERTKAALAGHDRQGLSPVAVVPGSIGYSARAIGGASLPLLQRFVLDRAVLLKERG